MSFIYGLAADAESGKVLLAQIDDQRRLSIAKCPLKTFSSFDNFDERPLLACDTVVCVMSDVRLRPADARALIKRRMENDTAAVHTPQSFQRLAG